jgi:hypothetical protein
MNNQRKRISAKHALLMTAAVALAMFTSPAMSAQGPSPLALSESAAISTMRRVGEAQAKFKLARDIDSNCDAVGEYGYFAELAGTCPMRVASGNSHGQCVPMAGSPSDHLVLPLLSRAMGRVRGSCVVKDGYIFQMYLAAPPVGGVVWATREDPFGGKAAPPFPDPITGAQLWCCYAWPLVYGQTGRRAFFMNQRGQVLVSPNQQFAPFGGFANAPYFDDAFRDPHDMSSPLRIGTSGGNSNSMWFILP